MDKESDLKTSLREDERRNSLALVQSVISVRVNSQNGSVSQVRKRIFNIKYLRYHVKEFHDDGDETFSAVPERLSFESVESEYKPIMRIVLKS